MKNISSLLIGLVVVVMMTGCGPRIVPVSSTTKTTTKTDSVSNKSEVTKDSSSYKETVKEKTLPAAVVGITLSKQAMDSLIAALSNLPSSVPKTVYYHDPKLRAMLSLALDSLGRFRINCTAMEQKYYERETEYKKFISQLVSENKSLKKEKTTLKSDVKEKRETWLQRTWQSIRRFGFWSFFIGFMVFVLALGMFKNFNIISIIKNLFK